MVVVVVIIVVVSWVGRAREFNGGDLLRLGGRDRRSGHGGRRVVIMVLVLLAVLVHHGASIWVHHARVSAIGEWLMRAHGRALGLAVGSRNKTRALLATPRISDALMRRIDRLFDNGRTRRNGTAAETLTVGLVETTSSSTKIEKSTGEKENSSTTNSDTSDSSGRKGLLSASASTVTVIGILVVLAWGRCRSRVTVLLWPFVTRSQLVVDILCVVEKTLQCFVLGRVNNAHHVVVNTWSRSSAIEDERVGIVDANSESRSILCNSLDLLSSTWETLAVVVDILVGNTWVIVVSSDDPMVSGVESPFDDIANISLELSRCELVSRLSHVSINVCMLCVTVQRTAPTLIVWVFSAAEEVPEAVSSAVAVGSSVVDWAQTVARAAVRAINDLDTIVSTVAG
jgi:hypothetical protein